MARFNIITLVNPSDKDFIERWDGDEYVVPAHGELAVPDFIAYHFCGNPNDPVDVKRALERRGDGGNKAVGLSIQIKKETSSNEEYIVDGGKPVAKVRVSKKKEEEN